VGTIIDGNTINGAGTDPSGANWNSAILINGNNTIVTNNKLSGILEWASEVWTMDDGWALGTVYHGNSFDMSQSRNGVAIQVHSTSTLGPATTVGCDNTVVGKPLSNISCR
jgi:hypothetical protein